MRYFLILASLFLIGPASTQTINRCPLMAANPVATSTEQIKLQTDADCFGRAATIATTSAQVRTDRVAAIAPKPAVPDLPFIDCAKEGATCNGAGWGEVRYGAGNQTRRLTVQGNINCDNDTLGDPAPNVAKRCQRRPVNAPLLTGAITPIASNLNTASLLVPGVYSVVASAKPDVVGAFRMICNTGHINRDDPILYPGVLGGSPHLHQWFGNTRGNYASTYASLRSGGDSTCSNPLNRSAYWVPALMTAAGKVIQPDYISIYYKRRPDGDPECLKESTKGCVGLPVGLRVVSGFDMKRMGETQPENSTFHFRCISADKPSDHRLLIGEAIADCGGSGQVMASIRFGGCWTGTLDSADHRSHLTHGAYVPATGQLRCPDSHPYLIPELTQGVVYTIEKNDSEVWFSSDRMAEMRMPGGSTFHADYMEGWEPAARDTWNRNCIGRLLNCSDGELGDGTMLKRGTLNYRAATRLMDVPHPMNMEKPPLSKPAQKLS